MRIMPATGNSNGSPVVPTRSVVTVLITLHYARHGAHWSKPGEVICWRGTNMAKYACFQPLSGYGICRKLFCGNSFRPVSPKKAKPKSVRNPLADEMGCRAVSRRVCTQKSELQLGGRGRAECSGSRCIDVAHAIWIIDVAHAL
jgi:hypothetical protein